MKVDDVQNALIIFIALLLEVGSGLGMYIAFSQWRLGKAVMHRPEVAQPQTVANDDQPLELEPIVATEELETVATVSITKPGDEANDNVAMPKLAAPTPETVSDVEQYREDRIEEAQGETLTATELYEDYCAWCEDQKKEPLALPTFGREFGELGVQKVKANGRVRYIGVALRSVKSVEEDKKSPASIVKAA